MSTKTQSLLPPKRSARRVAGVNVRFTQDEYDELERIANYREITVTELVYHVMARVMLPRLRNEMETELKVLGSPDSSAPPAQPS